MDVRLAQGAVDCDDIVSEQRESPSEAACHRRLALLARRRGDRDRADVPGGKRDLEVRHEALVRLRHARTGRVGKELGRTLREMA